MAVGIEHFGTSQVAASMFSPTFKQPSASVPGAVNLHSYNMVGNQNFVAPNEITTTVKIYLQYE